MSGNVSHCVLISKGIILVGDTGNLLCCFSQGNSLEFLPLDKVTILGVPDTPNVASINGVPLLSHAELFRYDDDNHTLSLSGLNCKSTGCDGIDFQKLTLKVTPA